ncbi:MAG: hypothetical protein Q9216_007055 [Gyalolechia sp. 2 TL-2023]
MTQPRPLKSENGNVFEDLSGISSNSTNNPYDALIEACGTPMEIQARYALHRDTRNTTQRQKFVNKDFTGVIVDPILDKLVNPEQYPDFSDERHCLVFWARPPVDVRALIANLQTQLRIIAPHLWLMPINCLHMTTLEITFSLTAPEIDDIVNRMSTAIPEITDYTYNHRARLIKPRLNYDAAAIALSFEPAAGESFPDGREPEADDYTYHHLRRDLYNLSKSTGVEVASRYVVPSAHLTIARFVSQTDVSASPSDDRPDLGKVEGLVNHIEKINLELQDQYWPKEHSTIKPGGEWLVGQEKGLDCRKGTLCNPPVATDMNILQSIANLRDIQDERSAGQRASRVEDKSLSQRDNPKSERFQAIEQKRQPAQKIQQAHQQISKGPTKDPRRSHAQYTGK